MGRRARRFARVLAILAAVIREPGLTSARLAARIGRSEPRPRRDSVEPRRIGRPVSWKRGYEVRERFGLEGRAAAGSLADTCALQVQPVRANPAPRLADRVTADVEAQAPAALAMLFAPAIERRLQRA